MYSFFYIYIVWVVGGMGGFKLFSTMLKFLANKVQKIELGLLHTLYAKHMVIAVSQIAAWCAWVDICQEIPITLM